MEIADIKEYNKIVIEVAREVSRPWKWATLILSVLLVLFVSFHFLCPVEVDIEQNNLESQHTLNYKG